MTQCNMTSGHAVQRFILTFQRHFPRNYCCYSHFLPLICAGIVPVACSELFRGIAEKKRVADKSKEEEYQVGKKRSKVKSA